MGIGEERMCTGSYSCRSFNHVKVPDSICNLLVHSENFSLRQVKTLDDLHKALHSLGYMVSRSGLYLRLLPRCQTTVQGKKHVNSLPVKLVRPQNDLRRKHPDRMFAAETSKSMDALAKFFGPDVCLYISQDDKSSVPIGRTAAKVQTPMLMSMQAKVRPE